MTKQYAEQCAAGKKKMFQVECCMACKIFFFFFRLSCTCMVMFYSQATCVSLHGDVVFYSIEDLVPMYQLFRIEYLFSAFMRDQITLSKYFLT